VWFAEFGGDRIGRISSSGRITEFGVPTPGSQPDQLATGPDGAIWFSEQAPTANRIGRITAAGRVREFRLRRRASYPSGVAAGRDGGVWFTEQGTNRIGRIAAVPTSRRPPFTG
jgi:virginiamycin B lyase